MSESMDIYKSLNINIEKVTTNSKLLKFFPYYLKTKKMCKHAVNKLRYLSATKIKKFVIKQSIVTLMH